ncbi:MAG: hypothetical protein QM723_37785 [Myxococcaceae bacterium]
MRHISVGTVVKEAADLWSQHLLALLPLGTFVYALGVAVFFGVTEGINRLPFLASRPGLADDASVLEALTAAFTLLAGPALGLMLGGAVITFFWAACCRVALEQAPVASAVKSMGKDVRIAVRFVFTAAVTLFLALIPVALATAIGGTAGRVVLLLGLISLVRAWPYWMVLVPLSQRDDGPFLRRFSQLVPREAKRSLWVLGGLLVLITVVVSVPAALAVTMNAPPLLVACVLVPFHAALAPMQAFIQARAYAQLTS